MIILTNVLSFIFALGVIIVVHEAGHLMVAKAFGIRVMTFSVGFGRSLLSWRRGETEYRISAVPLGGYVRLGGENPEESTGDPREFMSRPRWQRVLVYLAGPAMNVVLAVAIFAGLFMIGIEVPDLPDMPPIIGDVAPGSSAAAAHLEPGDLVVKVNGEPAASWSELSMALLTSPDKPVRLEVKRGNKIFPAVVTPRRVPRYDTGDLAGLFPPGRPQVIAVEPGSPAAAAGFRPGDDIRAVDGVPVADNHDFVKAISQRAGQRLQVEIVRQGKPLVLSVVPRLDGKTARIGVSVVNRQPLQRYPPGRALAASISYNIQIVRQTFQILGKIFRREMSPRGALAGPLEIATQAGEAARTGFKYLVHVMGFLSISIALLNLMPIPILDGGQIFILLVEGVIRRDLSLRVKEVISQVGFVLILMLMVVVFWFDVTRHLPPGFLPGS